MNVKNVHVCCCHSCVCKRSHGLTWEQRRLQVTYLWTARVASVEDEEFGFVIGDEGSGPSTHTRHISFEELLPPGPQSPSLRVPRHKNLISTLTTARTESDEAMEISSIWLMLWSHRKCFQGLLDLVTNSNQKQTIPMYNPLLHPYTSRMSFIC